MVLSNIVFFVALSLIIETSAQDGSCEIFDRSFKICCSGVLWQTSGMGDSQCCGQYAYDGNSSICCDGIRKVKSGMNDPKCCGVKSYDAKIEICCGGSSVKAIGGMSDPDCCGLTAYDKNKNYLL
jgi:hypothetical protein